MVNELTIAWFVTSGTEIKMVPFSDIEPDVKLQRGILR